MARPATSRHMPTSPSVLESFAVPEQRLIDARAALLVLQGSENSTASGGRYRGTEH
jgi:hypothetical protein